MNHKITSKSLMLAIALSASGTMSVAQEPTTQTIIASAIQWDRGGAQIPDQSTADSLFKIADKSEDRDVLMAAYNLGISSKYRRAESDKWLYKAAESGSADAQSIIVMRASRLRPQEDQFRWAKEKIDKIEISQNVSPTPSGGPALALAQVILNQPDFDQDRTVLLNRLGKMAVKRNNIAGIGIIGLSRIRARDLPDAIQWLTKGTQLSDAISQTVLAKVAIEHPDAVDMERTEAFNMLKQVELRGKASSDVFNLLSKCYALGLGVDLDAEIAKKYEREAAEQLKYECRAIDFSQCTWLKL